MIQVVRLRKQNAEELLSAAIRSRRLHHPWVTLPTTLASMEEYLDQPAESKISYGIRDEANRLAGVVNINSTIRGAFQSAFLGFFAFCPHEGRGLMSDGLAAVIDLGFREHELHRLEANVQPANERSAHLVRALGFRHEGRSVRYLLVDGEWKDHDRYALTIEEWRRL